MSTGQFRGAYTALVTPFKNGNVDEEAFRAHIEWQIEQGINGLVPCGTTGESATLTHEEHEAVIRICVEQTKKRVPIIAGAGSNNTSEAIRLTKFAKDVGADGVLHITPYYNKPTQEGLYQHFKAISDAVSIPVVMYNVPSRTGCNMLPATVARIAKAIPDVVGIKEATANLIQISDVLEQAPAGFQVLSGDDFTVLPLLSVGGCGVISVSANVAPAMMAGLCKAFAAGDVAEAKRLHFALAPLNRAMFLETNPLPVKTALALMGYQQLEFRLPLVPLLPENLEKLTKALKACNLLH
ncbi:MAG: 4-hydroxy-tetrahydrodipicolinate synthase [Bilophila sp.]